MKSMIPPEALKIAREAVSSSFVDVCWILEEYDSPQNVPTSKLNSDGRGGTLLGNNTAAPSGYIKQATSTPCRLEYLAPRKKGEDIESEVITSKTVADLVLPYGTIIKDQDKVTVYVESDKTYSDWQILNTPVHTDQLSLRILVEMVGSSLRKTP